MKAKKRKQPKLTKADIAECLRRGALKAKEVDKILSRVFRLTSAQWSQRLD